MKRLLVVSHASLLEVNRALFQCLAQVAKVDIRLIVPETWQGDLIQDLRFHRASGDEGIKVISIPVALGGNGSLYFYLYPLRVLIRGWKPHHVLIDEEPWALSTLQACLAFRRFQKSFFTKQNIRKKLPFPFPWIQKWVFSQTSHAYSVADEVTDVLRSNGYSKKINYLPHSYDPRLFRPVGDTERARRREELKIPKDAIVGGYFGRLTPEKGIEDLMEAVKRSSSSHFLIVGNGPLYPEVEKTIKELPFERVTLIPAIAHDHVGKTLAICDYLILPSRTTPSWKEQYGRILVEAMACGLAVVGSDSGEIPYLIARAGGGMTFQEKNPHDLLDKIEKLAQSPELLKSYAQKGRAYVEENLTHEAVAKYLARDLGFELK